MPSCFQLLGKWFGIISHFLVSNVNKDSNNARKSSSQTKKDEAALSHPSSNGKGKSENKVQARNTRIKESVTISQVLARWEPHGSI